MPGLLTGATEVLRAGRSPWWSGQAVKLEGMDTRGRSGVWVWAWSRGVYKFSIHLMSLTHIYLERVCNTKVLTRTQVLSLCALFEY
jgi:hypothetical protein